MPALSFLNKRAKETKADTPKAAPSFELPTLDSVETQDLPDIPDATPDPDPVPDKPVETANNVVQQETGMAQQVTDSLDATAGSIVGALDAQQVGMQQQTGLLQSIDQVLKEQWRFFTDMENRAQVKVQGSPRTDRPKDMLDESLLEDLAAGSGDGLLEGLLGGAAGGAAMAGGKGKDGKARTTVRKRGFKARFAEMFSKIKGNPLAKLLGGAALLGGSYLGLDALMGKDPEMRPVSSTVGAPQEQEGVYTPQDQMQDAQQTMMPDLMSMLGAAGLLGAGAVGVNKLTSRKEKETIKEIVKDSKKLEVRKEAAPAQPKALQKVAGTSGKVASAVMSGGGKLLSKAALPLTLASEGFSLYQTFTDPAATEKDKKKAVGGAAFGLGGASAGAAAGAAIGSFVPVLGTAVGGLVGGGLGYMAGTDFGKEVADFFTNETGELSLENLESFSEKAAKVVAGPASALTSVFDEFTSKENISKIKQTASSAIDAVRDTKNMMVDFFSDTVSYIMGEKETAKDAKAVVDQAKKEQKKQEEREKGKTTNNAGAPSFVVNNYTTTKTATTGDTTSTAFSPSDLMVNEVYKPVTKAVEESTVTNVQQTGAPTTVSNTVNEESKEIRKEVAHSIGVVGPTIVNGANKASQVIQDIAKSEDVRNIKNYTAANDSKVTNVAAGTAPTGIQNVMQYHANEEYAGNNVTNIGTLGAPSVQAPTLPEPIVAGQVVECMCPQGKTLVKMPETGNANLETYNSQDNVTQISSTGAPVSNGPISMQQSSASSTSNYNTVSNLTTSVRPDTVDRGSYESVKQVSVINQEQQTQRKGFAPATQPVPQQASSKPRIEDIPTVVNDHGMVFLSTGFF